MECNRKQKNGCDILENKGINGTLFKTQGSQSYWWTLLLRYCYELSSGKKGVNKIPFITTKENQLYRCPMEFPERNQSCSD